MKSSSDRFGRCLLAVAMLALVGAGSTAAQDGAASAAASGPPALPEIARAVGYDIDSGANSLVFTGDTWTNDALWPIVNRIGNLRTLIIETAFPNSERGLADASRHFCPQTLAEDLSRLKQQVDLYITHLKPGQVELTMREVEEAVASLRPQMLQHNQVFQL